MATKKTEELGYHYFIGSCLHWNIGMKVHELITKQKKQDRNKKSMYQASTYALWRVPVPLSTDYRINNYAPEVEGAELIIKEDY